MIIINVSTLETDNIQTSNQKEIDLSHRSEISPMNELEDMTHRKQILKQKEIDLSDDVSSISTPHKPSDPTLTFD